MERNSLDVQFKKLENYLKNLQKSPKITQVEFSICSNLRNSSFDSELEENLKINAELILSLIEKHRENIIFSSDLSLVFFSIISSKWALTPEIYLNINENAVDAEWLNSIFKKYSHLDFLLYLGMMKFIVRQNYRFSNEQFYENINSNMLQKIPELLPNTKSIDEVLVRADVWLDFADQICFHEITDCDILKCVLSVIISYWNHKLVQRVRVENLLTKLLKFDYSKQKNVVKMMLFKYANNMTWKIPFKYFVFLHWFKFVVSTGSISEITIDIKENFSEGFKKSLKNRNSIGVENEFFICCLNNFSYEDWKAIFDPLTTFAFQKRSFAMYYRKNWLSQILRKFPKFTEILYLKLSQIKDKNTYSQVLIALLRQCCILKIPHNLIKNEDQLLTTLNELLTIPEEDRSELFFLFGILRDQSVLYSPKELEAVFAILKYNVNSNCTMLRQSIFSFFSKFVMRLVCSSVRLIKKMELNSQLDYILEFLRDLNNFIIEETKPGCSYQRRSTCLNLYKIFMSYTIRHCGTTVLRNNLKDSDQFVQFAMKKNSWNFTSDDNRKNLIGCLMDSCEEVQNLSSTLLINYFKMDGIELQVFIDAVNLLKDNQFYRRNCGVSATISFISMSHNTYENPCKKLKIKNRNFMEFFLDMLEKSADVINEDILDSAVNHPVDGYIKILVFLMICKDSAECDLISQRYIERLLCILEAIVPLLLKAMFIDTSSDYAPSFEESDLALRLLIKKSLVKSANKPDTEPESCQLQPLYQLLLNFIWITLKVCCESVSSLIVNRINILNENQIIRCCNLIVNNLKYCRHKGVIEAAGVALCNVVKILTAEKICEAWLDSVLIDVINLIEFKSGASISRKSAGLSILIQNIVTGDKRPNKPSIFKCWSEFQRILDKNYNQMNTTVSQELPQTHALHFLKVLVNDARNTNELLSFLEDVTILSLSTLTAPVWVIRNAALQLFGALLPKIVGQRNPLFEIGVKYSFEEVFICMPRLLDYVICRLNSNVCAHKLIQNVDLAPILAILLNLKINCLSLMDERLKSKLLKLRILVRAVLKNDDYTIREMASKALVALYNPGEISHLVQEMLSDIFTYVTTFQRLQGENHLHGCLLVLKQIHSFEPQFEKITNNDQISMEHVVKVSLVSQTLLLDLGIADTDMNFEKLFDHITVILNIIKFERHRSIGYDQWLQAIMRILLKNYEFNLIIENCFNYNNSIVLTTCLEELARSSSKVDDNVFTILLTCLDHYLRESDIFILNCIMNTFIQLYKIEHLQISSEFLEKCYKTLLSLNYYHTQGLNLHMFSILAMNCGLRIDDALEAIYQTLDSSKFNKTVRLNSAQSMLKLSNILNKINKLIWNIVINLIQDEECDIKCIGSKCFCIIFHIEFDYGPEVTLSNLFNVDIVTSQLSIKEFLDALWEKLIITHFHTHSDHEIISPFDRDVVNYHKEEAKILLLIGNAIKIIMNNNSDVFKEYFSSNDLKNYFSTYMKDVVECNKSLGEKNLITGDSYVLLTKCRYVSMIHQFLNINIIVDNIQKSIEKL